VAFGVACGVAFGVGGGVISGVVSGVVFGVAFGLMGGVIGDVAYGVLGGVVLGVLGGVVVGVVVGAVVGAGVGVGFIVGSLRLLFYPFEVVHSIRSGHHAVLWDELLVVPTPPPADVILTQQLRYDEADGMRDVMQVMRNSFQRWAGQAALKAYLHTASSPIKSLYAMLEMPEVDEYSITPKSASDWRLVPALREMLLGELVGVWIDDNQMLNRVVWRSTLSGRDRRVTPLTRYCAMLYVLHAEKLVNSAQFSQAPIVDTYNGLIDYPGGDEIAQTYTVIAAFLNFTNLSDLPQADALLLPSRPIVDLKSGIYSNTLIRPSVVEALWRLVAVCAEIAIYRAATSRVSKLRSLARAIDALDDTDEFVEDQVDWPEQAILRRIIRQWRRLVSNVGGEIGRADEMKPVANPYVISNPVTGDLFAGRQGIMMRLEELWDGEGRKPSVVLYGHRRMGKSSILRNLGVRFGTGTIVVNFNTGELLYNLALAIADRANLTSLPEPSESQFTEHNPYTALNHFLGQLAAIREERRFIIAIDEFEIIEKLIENGVLDVRLLDYWRGCITDYPWLILVFAGLHSLEEKRHDYWHPLFGSVVPIPVSFLTPEAARQVIQDPVDDFPLDYAPEAAQRIIDLTNGQPYLIQVICHALVSRYNRQRFEDGVARGGCFTFEDVEAVINSPQFEREGLVYFDGVWQQARETRPAGQIAILSALECGELSVDEIAQTTGMSVAEVEAALKTLRAHDAVVQRDGRYTLAVELMRRWIANQRAQQGG
jgi:biotin operon repressor